VRVDNASRIAVKSQIAAIRATDRRLGAHDDRADDVALFDGRVRGALLNIDNDDIANASGHFQLAEAPNHRRFSSAGVVGDRESAEKLNHREKLLLFVLVRLPRFGRRRGDFLHNLSRLDHFDDPPALELAEGTSLHDQYLVARLALVLFIVRVNDRLAVNHLLIARVRNLVGDRYLDGLVP